MRTGRGISIVASALALLLWAAAPALAAPQRLSSDPEPGAELHQAPARVSLEFTEPLDDSSEIRIFDDCRNRLDAGDTTVDLNAMSVGVAKTPSGTYLVQYLAVGVTGTAAESFTFTVLHDGPTCDGREAGHGGHGGGGGEGGGHGGHGGGSGGGSGGGHGGHSGSGGDDHGAHSGEDTMHAGAHGDGGDKHDRHGKNKHGKHGKHGEHGKSDDDGAGANDDATLAAGDDGIPGDIPDGTTVLVALGLASIFGALGGWVLRISGP